MEAWAFNSRLQATSLTVTDPGPSTQLLNLGFDYGSASNNSDLLAQTIAAPGLTTRNLKYTYDAFNRLKIATENPASAPPYQCPDPLGSAWCEAYGYDQYGNRWVSASTGISQTMLTPTSSSWFDATNNRLVASGYDAAGNQTAAGGGTFTYDAESRMNTAKLGSPLFSEFAYTYDGEGRRVKRTVYDRANVYVYDAFGRLASEYRNGSWFKDFIYLADRLFVMESTAQATSYVAVDPLGSTRLVTGASRNVLSRHDYLPFGKELPVGIGGRTTALGYGLDERVLQRFTGMEVDPETGLDHFFFRYYSGRQGRFTTPDPLLGGDPTNPQSWNRYAYVLGNPLSLVDPLGLQGEEGPPILRCPFGFGAACEFWLEAMRRAREARSPFGPPPAQGGSRGGSPPKGGSVLSSIKNAICSALPEGRTTAISLGLGIVGGVTGGTETVVNYNTGEVSQFFFGGAQAGLSGGAQASISAGLIYGLGSSNASYSGPFTNASAAVGPVGIYAAASSGGLNAPTRFNWTAPNVAGVTLGKALAPLPASLTGSVTYYSKPLALGNLFGAGSAFANPGDYLLYAARRGCQ